MQLAEKLSSENLQSILPHRPPMLFINSVISCSEEEILCDIIVGAGAEPTYVDGQVKLPALIEYMAQTCAAYYGIMQSQEPNPAPGVIASIRNLEFFVDHIETGSKLKSQATPDIITPALSKFDCKISCEENLLASGSFSLVVLNKEDTT